MIISANSNFSLIEAIKKALPIDQAVTFYGHVQLRARGRRLWACCPLHVEKTPSLMIDRARGRAHCFGCGFDGDSIDFTAAALRMPLKDAMQYLAEQMGLSTSGADHQEVRRQIAVVKAEQKKRAEANRRKKEAFQVACSFLHRCYEVTHYTGPPEGKDRFLEGDQLWRALELQNWLDQITDILINGDDGERSRAAEEVLTYATNGQ